MGYPEGETTPSVLLLMRMSRMMSCKGYRSLCEALMNMEALTHEFQCPIALNSTTVAMKEVVSGSMICMRMRTCPAPSICAASQMASLTDSMPFFTMMMDMVLQQAGMIIAHMVFVSPSERTTR